MKLYVAGASSEVESVANAIQACRTLGFDITHDWTRSVRETVAAGKTDATLSFAARDRFAREDLDAVRAADIVWLMVPDPARMASRGCWVELGAAIESGRTVLVSNDDERSIFTSLAHIVSPTHAEALAYLADRISRV